jgi:outer membrane protein insertion porin family
MAKLPVESYVVKGMRPFFKAMFILPAPVFLLLTAITVQHASAQFGETSPSGGPAISAPASAPRQAVPAKEMVVEVRIAGNTMPVEKIKPFIRTREGRPFDKDVVEEDVRRLDSSKMFVNVETFFQRTPQGRIVIFKVLERPMLVDVKFVGNSKVSKKKLQKEAGLKAGDPLDPFAVEEARRKIEEYYRTSGYDKARVTLLEGDKPKDHRAIFLVNEGVKQKVQYVTFVGNTIASDARLRTQIKTKHPVLYLFSGELDRKELDEDVQRLTAYYRGLGFFCARIGREVREYDGSEDTDPDVMASRALRNLDQFETVQWIVVKFIIDEGPRYKIGNVSVSGNSKYTSEELLTDLNLKSGDYFNQAKMTGDIATIQDKYGGVGYVFADVKADPRFLEEPGTLDLVYKINEGDRYRVGKIDVQIKGEYPHTKITTVINRLSLHPGDIVDIREIRASERRMRASQLFESNPANGGAPKIVYSPPDKDIDEEDNKTQLARKPKYRSQSPDPNSGQWRSTGDNSQRPQRDRELTLVLEGTAANPQAWQQLPEEPPRATDAPGYYYRPSAPQIQNRLQPEPVTEVNQRQSELIVRGQYTPDAGRSTPAVFQRPLRSGARTAATTSANMQAGPADANAGSTSTQYSSAPSNQSNGYQGGSTYAQQQYVQPNYSQQQYTQQQYPQQQYPQTNNTQYSQQQYSQANDNQYPATQYETIQPGAVYSAQPGRQQPSASNPYNAAEAMPPPERVVEPILAPGSPFNPLTLDPNDPTRLLPMSAIAQETQTGRFMFGVGVTSDSGLTGTIKIEEQNFDLFNFPRSWDDIKNFTAWRGNGQRLVIEAYPGTSVQRYSVSFQEPYLFDSRVSMGLSGYYYSRSYTEWYETRVGGRAALGYQFSPDLSGNIAYRGARVGISDIIDYSIPDLAEVVGDNSLHGFQVSLAHDTRDNAFLATEGHLIQASIEEVIGTWQYPRAEIDLRQHYVMHERPDGSGRHVLSLSGSVGYTGDNTPVYDRYFAGGFSTIRGFAFRDASPMKWGSNVNDWIVVGGDFQLLASAEYMFPITADDMLRGVVFCDTGTVEPTIKDWSNKYRVAPGFGLRITVPAMGPAPLAFDFAFPVSWQPGDRFEMFSFFVGFGR